MKIQIKTKTGEILKEIEKDNLRYADLRYADLIYADLRDADLRGADLRGADLRGADLRDADLRGADLRSANLIYANLGEAKLGEANLGEANLIYANLHGANFGDADLRDTLTPIFCKWSHTVTSKKIKIGCETKTAEQWEKWLGSTEEYTTKRGTPEFRRIEAVIRACITYQKVINLK